MPWHCPACNSVLRHHELEQKPQSGQRYRCHVCRLTLKASETCDRLVVAPLDGGSEIVSAPDERRPRTIPPTVTASQTQKRTGKPGTKSRR